MKVLLLSVLAVALIQGMTLVASSPAWHRSDLSELIQALRSKSLLEKDDAEPLALLGREGRRGRGDDEEALEERRMTRFAQKMHDQGSPIVMIPMARLGRSVEDGNAE